MSRKKIYYPEFQITKGLKTDGTVWMLEDGTPYSGYYHKYTTGEVYTESEYDSTKSKKLLPLNNFTINPEFKTYNDFNINNNQIKLLEFKQPRYNKRIITDEEREQGWIERYFIKKRNDKNSKVIEVSKDEFETLKKVNTGLDGFLYKGISLKWKISGIINEVVEINKKSVISKLNEFNGLQFILVDFLEFFQK